MNHSHVALMAQLAEANKRIAELEEELMITEVWAELEIAELRATPVKQVKRSRINDRTEVFVTACRRAADPDNEHSILIALKELARSKHAFPQFLGYDAAAEEFLWSGSGEMPKSQSERAALITIKRLLEKKKSR